MWNTFDEEEEVRRAPMYRAIYRRFHPVAVMHTFLETMGIMEDVISTSTGGAGRCLGPPVPSDAPVAT